SRLGDLGTALGKGIKGFKRSMKEPDEIDVTPQKDNPEKIEDTDLEKASENSEKKTEAK
ncbi:MAG: hypothetical protein GTN99_08190, partial [Candidatus Dadabacteria bacterium]|nr:hypothetical protein [Candidatus Dadabacteria bacterium]